MIEKGNKKCPAWLRKKYKEAVNFTCQECHKPESEVGELQIHRKIRETVGDYIL